MLLSELVSYIDDYLDVAKIPDCSLNGLQVEGFKECQSIATAASASLEAIDAAIESGADTLIVHHGLFWKGQTENQKDSTNCSPLQFHVSGYRRKTSD